MSMLSSFTPEPGMSLAQSAFDQLEIAHLVDDATEAFGLTTYKFRDVEHEGCTIMQAVRNCDKQFLSDYFYTPVIADKDFWEASFEDGSVLAYNSFDRKLTVREPEAMAMAERALNDIRRASFIHAHHDDFGPGELYAAGALRSAVHEDVDAIARHFWMFGATTDGGYDDLGIYGWDIDFRDGSRLSYDESVGFEVRGPETMTMAERVREKIEDAFATMAEATVDDLISPTPELANARAVMRMAYGNPKGLACLCPHTKVTTRPDWGWDICYTDGSMLMCRRTDDGLDLTVITRVPNPFED